MIEYPIHEAIFGEAFRDLPDGVEEMRAKYAPKFPPVVRAEDMHRECVRDGWIMGAHPVRWLRGNDHD